MEKYKIDYSRVEDRRADHWMMILEAIEYYLESATFVELETVLAILGITETDEYRKEKKELEELFGIDKGGTLPCSKND